MNPRQQSMSHATTTIASVLTMRKEILNERSHSHFHCALDATDTQSMLCQAGVISVAECDRTNQTRGLLIAVMRIDS